MALESFILGLSSSMVCAVTCAPVLIPYLLGEGRGMAQSTLLTIQFLLGRLSGYLLFAVFAWAMSRSLLSRNSDRDFIVGAAYLLFSALLIYHGFFRREASRHSFCAMNRFQKMLLKVKPALLPWAAGLVTGLSFCPPFLLAFTGAAAQISLTGSLLYFFSFFTGTSVLFFFAPLVGALKRFPVLQIVGKLAAGVMGIYYLYAGGMMILGGMNI